MDSTHLLAAHTHGTHGEDFSCPAITIPPCKLALTCWPWIVTEIVWWQQATRLSCYTLLLFVQAHGWGVRPRDLDRWSFWEEGEALIKVIAGW